MSPLLDPCHLVRLTKPMALVRTVDKVDNTTGRHTSPAAGTHPLSVCRRVRILIFGRGPKLYSDTRRHLKEVYTHVRLAPGIASAKWPNNTAPVQGQLGPEHASGNACMPLP